MVLQCSREILRATVESHRFDYIFRAPSEISVSINKAFILIEIKL